MVEHLLDRAARYPGSRNPRSAALAASRLQLHAVHHHPAQRADPPVGLQGEAEQAIVVFLMVAAQLQLQALAKARIEAHVPVLQVQLPAHHHLAFVGVGIQQAPFALPRPALLRPFAAVRMAAEPRPADRDAAAHRRAAEGRPFAGAPQQRAFALRLEMQELRPLPTEYGLAQRMVDQQQIATLEAYPVERSLGPHGMKETLQRMLKHVRLSYPLPFPESPGVHPCSFTTFRTQAPNDRHRKSVVGL